MKCVGIVSSLDKAFCAGADILGIEKTSVEEVVDYDFMDELRTVTNSFSKPLVMGVNGYVLGGGMELALTADILICT